MDVSERRENSIRVIENYVEQYYSTHQNLFANPSGCVQPKPFRFPPGHRMQIINFVREVKKISKVGQKHKLGDPTLICKAKIKKKRHRSSFHEPNDGIQFDEETIADVSEQVRCSASAWVQKETDPIMHSLKETTDFSVSAKFLDNILSVEMKCVPCNTTLQLQPDSKKPCRYILSN